MQAPLEGSASDLDDFFGPRRSRDNSARNSYEVLSPASNHNREAALLVAQYLSQSPRNAEDLATGYGALRRGQRADEEASAFSVGSHLPSMPAARQQPASEREPLARAASTPDEAAVRIQQFYRKHRSDLLLRKRSFSKFGQEAFDLIRRHVDTGGSGSGLYEENIAVKARLILHFDINKTILMSDKAQDASTDHMVNVLLCECAWGRLEPGPKWVPVGRLATDRPSNDPQLMSYRSFLDSFLLPSHVGSSPDIEKHNNEVKNVRQALKRAFTDPGQPGEMFRGIFKQLKDTLTLPEACKAAAQQSSLGYLFAHGERHILPSFFNLLIHLQKQERDFTLVFRTFGSDIAEVVDEINMFATGQHPAYPEVRMDGSDGRTDLRMSIPEHSACFLRTTAKPDGSHLLLGADRALLVSKKVTKGCLEAAAEAGLGQHLTSFQAMHAAIMQKAESGNRAYAIRDYYPFWKSRNERSRAGKLLLLDRANEDVIQIFFDDNIGHGSANIVDVRDVMSGEPLAFQDVTGKNLLKVEPLNAILDPQYFVRAVHQCTLSILHGREKEANLQAIAGLTPQGSSPTHRDGAPGGFRQRVPPAVHSRRGRELWSIVHRRLTAVVRLRAAMRNA